MQIHQFYFISDVDDDAVTLFAVQVNPVISFEICYDARRHSSPYCCWSLWWISADGTFSATRNLITMCCSTLRGTFCSLITLATPRQDWTGSNPSRREGGGCGFTIEGRTAAAQCGLFTHKSVPVIFEPPCTIQNWKCPCVNEGEQLFLIYEQRCISLSLK